VQPGLPVPPELGYLHVAGTGTLAGEAAPSAIARAAAQLGCRSVAFTYNDPVIFLEYAIDVADACHQAASRRWR
jgi:pyruvate-formate lyase-activating enzyme